MVPCQSFFRCHFADTRCISNSRSSPWPAEIALIFHVGFMINLPLIKIFPIDSHAINLCASRQWQILALDTWRMTHMAFYDMTIFFCCVINKRSRHQECFECLPQNARWSKVILLAIISEKFAFDVKEINSDQLVDINVSTWCMDDREQVWLKIL